MRTFRYVLPLALALTVASAASSAAAPCDCDGIAYLGQRFTRFSRGASVLASGGVNNVGGRFKISADVFMPAATSVNAETVIIGPGAYVGDVNAPFFKISSEAVVQGTISNPPGLLPLTDPFCEIPASTCNDDDLAIDPSELGPTILTPGTYGDLRVKRGAAVRFQPGTYNFCGIQISKEATAIADGPVTINAVDNVKVAILATLAAEVGQPRIELNVAGKKVAFAIESTTEVATRAPFAAFKIGRAGTLNGCVCARKLKVGQQGDLQCTGSPSGAFLD